MEVMAQSSGAALPPFGSLYEQHYAPIVVFLRGKWRMGVEDARDTAQVVFERAFKAYPRFTGGGADLKWWLWTIASHAACDEYRHRKPIKMHSYEELCEKTCLPDRPAADVDAPERHHEYVELSAELERLLARVPHRYATALRLSAQGYEYGVIAETLGITIPAVKAMLHRARAKMRQLAVNEPRMAGYI